MLMKILSESFKARIMELAGIPGSNLNDNFKKWFDGSKVVDKEGNPAIVHHGTGKKFSKFNFKNAPQKIIWFTSNKASVEAGEVGAAGRGHIFDLYALIKKPAGWDEYGKYGLGQLHDLGYDGAILPDPDGSFTGFVFEPNQLKSVSNKGEWNPGNSNIMKEENMSGKLTVYHGSDRKFDDFDMSKVGSGDGKSLGGWGIYFSTSPTVSKRYVLKSGFLKRYEIKNGLYFNLDEQIDSESGSEILMRLKQYGSMGNHVSEESLEQFQTDFIDYNATGKQVYDWLSYVLGGDKEASEFLLKIGYLGTKFNDKWESNAENYVVFDTKYIFETDQDEDY